MSEYSAVKYLLDDLPRTLFPLNTTRVLIEHHAGAILEYIYNKILKSSYGEHSFLPQLRCHASKYGFHLRRTIKLDPVAELYIYDLVYRNRQYFRKDFRDNRKSFGYRFEGGHPVSLTKSYGEFKTAVSAARKVYRFSAKFDISSYFNSLYHHDLVAWFSENGRTIDDTEHFGQFLRETNAGRSIDCLPHGIHPCKVIGAEFLKFIDNSINVRCQLLLRFMDDFYLFDNDENTLTSDFLTIQRLLGERSLSLNSAKTRFGQVDEIDMAQQVGVLKASLLKVRRQIIEISGLEFEAEDDESADEYGKLNNKQVEYLLYLLKDPEIVEADAELVLVLLRDHGEDVLEHMHVFFEKFPSLSKSVYTFCQYVHDKSELATLLKSFLQNARHITENQLFWMAKIAEDFLGASNGYADILHLLYNHSQATPLTQAKILEIPEHRFGFPELRAEHLRVGKSDWISWAAAAGCRNETKIRRNHVLVYFAKASPMNKIIADCITARPST